MPTFSQKTSILSETASFYIIFFNLSSIFGPKNVNSVKTTLYQGSRKSIVCPFLSDYSRESQMLSYPYLVKKHPFSIKLIKIFCRKYVLSLKNKVLSFFFQILYEKIPAVMPIFGQKNVNTDKTAQYYGPKKSIGRSFFRFFTKNPCYDAHIL